MEAPAQLSVSLKSPVTRTWLIVSDALPRFATVIVCASLAVPTAWLAKARAVGFREIAGGGAFVAVSRGICQMPRPYVAARSSPARPSPVDSPTAAARPMTAALGRLGPSTPPRFVVAQVV